MLPPPRRAGQGATARTGTGGCDRQGPGLSSTSTTRGEAQTLRPHAGSASLPSRRSAADRRGPNHDPFQTIPAPDSCLSHASEEETMFVSAAAAAKSLQSCPILCDPIDSSPPGSAIPGNRVSEPVVTEYLKTDLVHTPVLIAYGGYLEPTE